MRHLFALLFAVLFSHGLSGGISEGSSSVAVPVFPANTLHAPLRHELVRVVGTAGYAVTACVSCRRMSLTSGVR